MKNKIWEQNSVLQQDLEQIAASEQIDWEKLAGRSILITGATGLIGSLLARSVRVTDKRTWHPGARICQK